jgi:hypothetical protein
LGAWLIAITSPARKSIEIFRSFVLDGLNRKENPINPAEMIRLVGRTEMTMICRVHYHADMQRIGEKVAAM